MAAAIQILAAATQFNLINSLLWWSPPNHFVAAARPFRGGRPFIGRPPPLIWLPLSSGRRPSATLMNNPAHLPGAWAAPPFAATIEPNDLPSHPKVPLPFLPPLGEISSSAVGITSKSALNAPQWYGYFLCSTATNAPELDVLRTPTLYSCSKYTRSSLTSKSVGDAWPQPAPQLFAAATKMTDRPLKWDPASFILLDY